MAFDQLTRNRLQRFVNNARKVLEEEFTRQLQNDYGLDPHSGIVTPLANMRHLNDAQHETARILRDTLAHYRASQNADPQTILDRIVREQAFTVLNRLAALRMAEARGLLIESVGNGYQAKGFQLYARLAGTGLGETGDAYRIYLFSVFDELSQDLPGLFDRYSPQGRLFPREAALLPLLALINDAEMESLWGEDETIGWIYQYFNSKEERKAMRDASQAPRNSRELAVRNQFFTPRYVVEFLVDNTLGRWWFNATGGQTGLRDRCQYLLAKPDEVPPVAVKLRDPRTLKLLDPACGSMHFGLYAFDLFAEIYREAWAWEQQHGPGSLLLIGVGDEGESLPLCQTYPDEAAFLRDVPRLIIEHNLYGVDIDPRAAQIASLALWLRAQRAWQDMGVKAKDRPVTGRGHVVAAIAPPAEPELRQQFAAGLDRRDAELFEKTLQLLKGLPELGVLLQVERELPHLIRQVYVGKGTGLFAEQEQETWRQAETRLREALTDFIRAAKSTYQGRLFAQDALQGLRLIDLCREVFDVVVMNPPFGEFSVSYRDYAKDNFSSGSHDILTAFVEIGLKRLRINGLFGAITSRTSFFAPTTRQWRESVILRHKIHSWIDLGDGVLDDAMVETCLYTIEKTSPCGLSFFASTKHKDLIQISHYNQGKNDQKSNVFMIDQTEFSSIDGSPFAYWLEPELFQLGSKFLSLEKSGVQVRVGLQTGDDFRFIRCWWEIRPALLDWISHAKGGENEPFVTDIHLVVKWGSEGAEMKAQDSIRLNMYSKIEPSKGVPPGLTFSYRTHRFSPAMMPAGTITGVAGMGIYSSEIDLFALATILNSSLFNEMIDVRLGLREINALYQSGAISPVPFPKLNIELTNKLSEVGQEIWKNAVVRISFNEECLLSSGYYCNRHGLNKTVATINELWRLARQNVIQRFAEIDLVIAKLYGIDEAAACNISKRNYDLFVKSFPSELTNEALEAEKLVSYSISRIVGKKVVVFSEVTEIKWVDPIKYLTEGNPKTLPINGSTDTMSSCLSIEEIVIGLEAVCAELFSKPVEAYEEFLRASEYQSVEHYLSDPSGFFSSHLKRYSKSRRKAPIYWPLATASGSYTLWLYYPNLTSQTLYTAINDFVEPKLKQVRDDIAALRDKGAARSKNEEKQFEALQVFELELIDLHDTLLNIAPNYKPHHDDGVQITAAPLWPLFRHKPWQKVLKDTWAKLEKGEYDWAHLAMNYWPDRVREKCKTDKSLAIAHGLEDLYIEPEAKPKPARGRKKLTE